MMPETVVFVHSTSDMSGVEFSTLNLLQSLDPRRWQPFVVVPREGELSRTCLELGIPFTVVRLPRLLSTSLRLSSGSDRRFPNPFAWLLDPWLLLAAARRLARFFDRRLPTLVVSKGMQAHFCGGLACRWTGAPCLWHLQDLISNRYAGLYARFFGLAASRLADQVVADGSPILEQLPPAIQQRGRVIFNSVDTGAFRPGRDGAMAREALGIDRSACVIGHAARLTPWKGQRHLLEAFGLLAGRNPGAHLLLVGSALFDSERYALSLQQAARDLGLEGRVTFAGFRSDLAEVLAAMDIFVYPSLEKDTSPLSLLSAMACGLPVIAYDIPGVREVVVGSGILVPLGDRQQLAGAIQDLLDDPQKRRRLGEACRERLQPGGSRPGHAERL